MFKKRVLATLMAAVMCAAMLPISSMAVNNSAGNETEAVTRSKTATELNVYDQTTVTLTIGSTQETVESNVVFVLDKSTSDDVRKEAGEMLDALVKKVDEGNVVNVAVIAFESTASTICNWTSLTNTSVNDIKSAINQKKTESGTNIYLGLTEGKKLLDEKVGGDNHLVLVTDGITYLWGGENGGTTYSIYSEQIGKNEEVLSAGNDMMVQHYDDPATYYEEFNDIATWYSTRGSDIKDDIEEYQTKYVGGHFDADVKGQMENSTYETYGAGVEKYIPGEELTEHYCANDAAVYMAVTAWEQILTAGYHAYAYADATPANASHVTTYPWASAFVGSLNTLGGNSTVIREDDVKGMFDSVKNSILYEIGHGTVTDKIGDYFTLVDDTAIDTDTFTLTVGGTEVTNVELDNDTVNYYVKNDDGEDVLGYSVTYHQASDNQDAYFTWDIKVPVETANPVQLSYDVKLDRDAAKAANEDIVYTNKSAELKYYPTDSNDSKTVDFERPQFPIKTSEPSVEKKSNGNNTIGAVKNGDIVPFTLNSTLPEKLGTEDYELTFTDTMSGLVLNENSVEVTIGGTALQKGNYTLTPNNDGTSFTLTINVSQLLKAGTITEDQLKAAAAVVVSYKATVTAENDNISNTAEVNGHQAVITGTVTPGGVSTGGTGTTMYTVGGAVLLMAAGALYITTRKKESRS